MQDAGATLAGLGSARTPWLALALGGPATDLAPAAGDVTVIDIADPQAVPVTVNPLEPGPGYPVQAHADRLAGLFEAAFGLAEPVGGALRAGLRRAYADGGWDMRTGAACPGAAGSPAVPSFRQLRLATLAAIGELGYGTSMRAAVRGFLAARLDALWTGPAGRFLEGGHPVDLARLLRGNVLVTSGAVSPLLSGRRSAACGERCRRRPCDGYELNAAGLLAEDHGQAWLRLWVQTLVLAFLTGRPVPRVPVPLRAGWEALTPRGRECLLAIVVDTAVNARAAALRPCYDPRCLAAVIAAVAGRMLAAGAAVPVRAGPVWVIPQLRWLHEMERLHPLGRDRLRPDDIAPPLDFGLAGLPDWPGIRVADRLGGLRRHPLAMESQRNRTAASTALLGRDGSAALDADLATAGIGISPPLRLRHAARMMGAGGHGRQPGWLEVVLSWPHRIIRPGPDVHHTATG